MTISNVISSLEYRGYQIPKTEKDMLYCLFEDNDEFDSYIITSKKSILNSINKPNCYIIQDGAIRKSLNLIEQQKPFWGLFVGLNHCKILVIPRVLKE